MRTDAVHVAIRPRGILECLDLAVMFCGRRPLAVGLATALGALPFILLNRAIFAGARDDDATAAALVLALEAAWAAVPLTLYLGQSVFSDRFSIGSALRAGLGSLPSLLLFQGLLRTVCLGVCLLAPVVFVGMYYLDQIILLERPPLSRVWRRRSAMNRGQLGRVARLACVDGLLLACGTVLGTRVLGAASRLWSGRGLGWEAIIGGDDGLVAAAFTWHGQIAFWAACGFVTVFRFITYLDARIRREGWDVELRLRDEQTYAGLPPSAGGRHRGTTIAALVLLLAAPTAAAWGASPAGDAAAEGDARRALARQSFPWYDADSDRFRPLIRPEQESRDRGGEDAASSQRGDAGGDRAGGGSTSGGPSRRAGSGGAGAGGSGRGEGRARRLPTPESMPSPLSAEALGTIARVLMIGLLVAAVAVVIWTIVRYGLRDRTTAGESGGDDDDVTFDDPDDALPAGLRRADGDLLGTAAAHANRGDFAAAMLHLHAWMLVELDRRGGLVLARGKTNGQYRAEVAASLPMLSGLFETSSRLFEDVFFGRLPIGRGEFQAVWERRDLVTSAIPPAAGGP